MRLPMFKKIPLLFLIVFIALISFQAGTNLVQASSSYQQPTVAIPTVTGTPKGPIAIVYSDPEEQINVRSGPDVFYPKVGVLIKKSQRRKLQ